MTFTDAAREVLRMVGRPLHYKEITELAIEKNLLSHVGKSPDVTMGARLAATLKKEGESNPLIRVKPGVFALRDWDDETIKKGLDIKRAPARAKAGTTAKKSAAHQKADDAAAKTAGEADDGAKPAAAADAPAPAKDGAAKPFDTDTEPRSVEEELRAEMAASATGLFAEEDDDDKPILGPAADSAEKTSDEASTDSADQNGQTDTRRRRRRRRRRGSRTNPAESEAAGAGPAAGAGANGLPSYTTSPAFDASGDQLSNGATRGPQVIELSPGDTPSLDGLAGRDLPEAIATILSSFDRTVGAVSLRQIAETAQRRGKLAGDAQLMQSQIAAAVRADNARRVASGDRPRFRMAGGRVGLTDWLLEPELARLEREAIAALGRYRDAARRAFVRKLAELPGHAFVELCLLLLERVGATGLRPVKFAGASGSETHLGGLLHAPAGVTPGGVGTGDGLKVAIAIRRDGRDIGRERVSELRGTVHHYGSCGMGWILTTGQVLSGAREEASAPGVLPVTLLDGPAIARLADEYGLAVVRAQHPIAIPDVDLFEALRAC